MMEYMWMFGPTIYPQLPALGNINQDSATRYLRSNKMDEKMDMKFTMILHDSPWFTMIHHDSPWFTMIHHDSPTILRVIHQAL